MKSTLHPVTCPACRAIRKMAQDNVAGTRRAIYECPSCGGLWTADQIQSAEATNGRNTVLPQSVDEDNFTVA